MNQLLEFEELLDLGINEDIAWSMIFGTSWNELEEWEIDADRCR